MLGRTRATTVATIALLAGLILPSVVVPAAGAAPVVATGGAPEQWAYGAQHWSNHSANSSGGAFNASAYFGWAVIVTVTNTSATTIQVQATRTLAEHYYARFCHPNCSSPAAVATLSESAWQIESAFVNLTTTATVDVKQNATSSVATAALGVQNATDGARGSLTESYVIDRGGSTVASGALSVSRTSGLSIAFAPALGLVPFNLTTNESWNSTSAFAAAGGWNDTFSATNSLAGSSGSINANASSQLTRSGVETLRGVDLGNVTLSNGRSVAAIVLIFRGPVGFGDGLFLNAAGGSDLFGGIGASWSGRAFSTIYAQTATVDMIVDAHHRSAVFAASEIQAGVGTSELGASSLTNANATGSVVGPTAPPSDNESIQSQPESVAQAQAQSSCMIYGCGGSTPNGASPSNRNALIAAVVVVVVIVVVAGVLLARRARPPAAASEAAAQPDGAAGDR